jgi:PAS domain S-box-containing protein
MSGRPESLGTSPEPEDYERLTRAQLIDELRKLHWQFRHEFQRVELDLSIHQEELASQNEELRHKQQLLEASREHYAELYDFAPLPYMSLDQFGAIVQINLTGSELLGLERSRVTGTPLLSHVLEPDRRILFDHLRRCRENLVATSELRLVRTGAPPVPAQLHSRAFRPADTGGVLFRTTFTDLTEIKQAEEALRAARNTLEARVEERTAELQRANQALQAEVVGRQRKELELREANAALRRSNDDLNQFAHAASHDLKEPLRTIATFSQLLQERCRHKIDAEADGFIEHVVQGARQMDALLRDLLEYAQAGQTLAHDGQVADANAALRKVAGNLDASVQQSGATITHDPLPVVKVHEVHLIQIFQNLIGNALKYRREESPRIHVSAYRNDQDCTFSVADNGMGIDPAYTRQVFGIFKRLHGNKYPGTGMGLAICSKIIGRYGGRIWLDSEPGKGSVFRFTLPVGDAHG